jgi:hypothetical protein
MWHDGPTFRVPVTVVISLRAKKQMGRVNARRVIAVVANL